MAATKAATRVTPKKDPGKVTWSQIEDECSDYRAGFVATFRKHEGKVTDEKAKNGHAVKVTMSSFARHVGIAETTFKDWVKRSAYAEVRPERQAKRDSSLARSNVRRLPDAEKQALAREILAEATPEVRRKAFVDLASDAEVTEDAGTRLKARHHLDGAGAKTRAKITRAGDQGEAQEKARGDMQCTLVDSILVAAKKEIREAVTEAHGSSFTDEHRALLRGRVEELRHLLDVLVLDLDGSVDWDAALAELGSI